MFRMTDTRFLHYGRDDKDKILHSVQDDKNIVFLSYCEESWFNLLQIFGGTPWNQTF